MGVLALLFVAWAWWTSVLPGSYSVMSMGRPDFGGGAEVGHHADAAAHTAHAAGAASLAEDVPDPAEPPEADVTTLTADPDRPADVRVELVARAERITPAGGQPFDGFTLNGQTPGPTIRATAGQLIEVELRNEDVPEGITAHWHGVDVPGAMDGVAGVTQDAVGPGETFTYRFVAEQVGTFWYHSHQVSHSQVIGGLFGALVLEPEQGADAAADAVAMIHTYPGGQRTLNGEVGEVHQTANPGDIMRVRLVNTDNSPTVAWVAGSDFRVLAIDGTELNAPTPVEGRKVGITAGGRADLEVRVPGTGAVRVQVPGASLVITSDTVDAPTEPAPREAVDLLSYGSPVPAGFDAEQPDRVFDYDIGRLPGFLDGLPGYWWTINGGIVPSVPMYMVEEGDVVVMRISNGSGEVHPMHLHGHHLLVLSRDGVPSTGSPWWVDSLNIEHGESFEVAFVADNPGIWMDHCHNLAHASEGLMTHLAYAGVTTPFRLGRDTGNDPE